MRQEKFNSIEIDKERFEQWIVLTARDWRDLNPILPVSGITVLEWDRRSLLRCAFEARRFIVDAGDSLAVLANNPILRSKLENVVNYYKSYCAREDRIFRRLGLGAVLSMYDINHHIERLNTLCRDLLSGHFVSESILHETLIHMFIGHFKMRTPKDLKEKVIHYLSHNPKLEDIVILQPITGTPWVDHTLLAATQALVKLIDASLLLKEGRFVDDRSFARALRFFNSLLKEEEEFGGIFPENKMKMHWKEHAKLRKKLDEYAQATVAEVDREAINAEIMRFWLEHLHQKDSRDYAFYMVADTLQKQEDIDAKTRIEQMLFYFCRSEDDVNRMAIFQHILNLKPLDLQSYQYDSEYIVGYMGELRQLVEVYDKDCLNFLLSEWKTVYCPQLVENANFLHQIDEYQFFARKGALIYDSILVDRLLKGWIMNTNVIGKVPNPMVGG